jgi:hypothetical protein
MSQMPIDLDAEAIYFDGHWYTRDDLARRIKAMLDNQEFAVTRPSAALEELTAVMGSVRSLAFRCTPEMIEAINVGAARAGKSVGAFMRDVAAQHLGLPSTDFGPTASATAPAAQPAPIPLATPVAASAPVPPPAPSAPTAGPGAMRAASTERLPSVMVEPQIKEDPPVELTKKKEEQALERGWFNS